MSRRKAPHRAIKDIWRTGTYGDVAWHHRLECGHVEVRPRAAAAPKIACEACLEEKIAPPTPVIDLAIRPDPITTAGLVREGLVGALARHFGVRQEMVDVAVDYETGEVSFATLMLDREALVRLGLLR